jgi:hypothetical protein
MARINPLDKATIVSIVPFDILEFKYTLFPGRFFIPKAEDKDFQLLTVGQSFFYQEMGDDRPAIQVPEGALGVAESIVNDFVNAQVGCDMAGCMPGIGYLPGELTKQDFKTKKDLQAFLVDLDEKQTTWFKRLVYIADTLWVRTNGQPASISDTARLAARRLNLIHKEWLKDSHATELVRCPACGNLNSDMVVVCPVCKIVIDPVRFAALGLQFAGEPKQLSSTLESLVK